MPKFTVIRASAGSGKTFSLTQEYLRLILSRPGQFRHILAVTFTNKATEEMKSRIIHELYLLSSFCKSHQLEPLIRATGLDEQTIRERSGRLLKLILHQYSWFAVNTIDRFFQRIIRNFTRELGIQEGYIIELDTEPVLTEVIDRLLINAGHDRTLLDWLSVFAESLIERGENWNLKRSIRRLGNEIFREEFKSLNNESIRQLCNREFMKKYRDDLYTLQRNNENLLKKIGTRAMSIIRSHGMTVDDFNRKSSGPAGYFAKISEGDFIGPSEAVCEAILRKEKWYTQSSPIRNKIESLATGELMPLLKEAKQFFDDHEILQNSASVILKNLYTLGILIDLSELADSWCSENNTFLLPEAPVFLNRIIDGNDTPFIYEKAGCWFHNFMIDEFQDTSVMQWSNFKPLISNSLSQSFDNLAVGDIKQSIYRWRNSNWDILESMIGREFLPGIVNEISLSENRRSRENIVHFNNFFFSEAAKLLQENFNAYLTEKNAPENANIKPITQLYREVEQIPARDDKEGGYVGVWFMENGDDEDYDEKVNNKVADIIHDLLDKGYNLKDIAILTRKNQEAANLADFLIKYKVDGRKPLNVISDEALYLDSSVMLNLLIGLLKYIVDPDDRNNNYFLASVSLNYMSGNDDEPWVIPETGSERRPRLNFPASFLELAKGVKATSLTEIVEKIINIFSLDASKGELVYLMAFRDLVQEYLRNHSSNLLKFLEFWDEIGSKRSVPAPSGQDAIRILTLHKAKGLEFKVTILPYCTWEFSSFDRSFIWCKPEQEPFDKLSVLPINYSKKLSKTIFAREFYEELHKQMVDNLNLMYVAFTRARDGMYIICKETSNDNPGNASALTRLILNRRLETGSCIYESGKLTPQKADPGISYNLLTYQPAQNETVTARLKIAFQGKLVFDPETSKPARPVNDGRILHEVFNLIRKRSDIKMAVSLLHLQGKIASDEQNRFIRFIEQAMNDIQVSTWFSGDWKVMTEAEIIVPGGEIRRPDRVMQSGNQTLLIDYKFGLKTDGRHEEQIREYAELLRNMGSGNVDAYLWYVKLGKVVQVSSKSVAGNQQEIEK